MTMAVPWYLPGTMFLSFVLFALLMLVLIYWKANVFLRGNTETAVETYSESCDEIEAAEDAEAAIKMVDYAAIGKEDPLSENEAEQAFEMIDHASMTVMLSYMKDKKYLTCSIKNMTGIFNFQEKNASIIRLHVTLLASKRLRARSGYRSLDELSVPITVGLKNADFDSLKVGILRIRVYGRRFEFGVPVTRERILGEANIDLTRFVRKLEVGTEILTKEAITPMAETFPSPNDGF